MTKQVIVIRKDLNMRKGKMIAQGAHASLNAFLSRSWLEAAKLITPMKGTMAEWFNGSHTKITVYVKSEEELLAVFEQAREANLPRYLVRDAGHTEFKGVPTLTACAIGPDDAGKIDKITGDLPLL